MGDGPNSSDRLLRWRIVMRRNAAHAAVPPTLLTRAGAFRHENMPDEVAMLLPAGDGPTALVDTVVANQDRARDSVLGLFLASPLINVDVEAERLSRAGVRWIANLPSVTQQDEEFSRQLVDVGLDQGRELRALSRFRACGFGIAATVSNAAEARAAADIGPDAVIVMPRIAEYAAGFPSLRQRASAVQSVHEALRDAQWRGVLVGLGESRDADSESLWPPRADALLCRPA